MQQPCIAPTLPLSRQPLQRRHIPGRRMLSLCLLWIVTGALTTGCTGFERDWRASRQFSNPCDSFAGRWEGTWLSDKNGHRGKLRALITPTDCENLYHARFKATYAFIIPYQFEIPMTITTDEQGTHFEGQADLGWLAGGIYTYTGDANHGEFLSNYCASGGDHGTFRMSKLDACCHDGNVVEAETAIESEYTAPTSETAADSADAGTISGVPTFEQAVAQ